MKKILSLLLAAALTLGFAASCGKNEETGEPDPSSAEVQSPTGVDAEAETDRTKVKDSLPELDFRGATAVIHSRGDAEALSEVVSEELKGEAVADSIFERNNMVSERLNVKLEAFAADGWESYDNTIAAIRASVMSRDGAYDIIAGWSSRIPILSLEGLFLNLNEADYLDTGREWWSASATKELQIANKLYFVTGDIARTMLSSLCVYVFNQKVAEDYGIENLYDVVKERRWTVDYVRKLSSGIYTDLNGNGERDLKDSWGLVASCINDADAYMQGSLVSMVQRDEEGYPHLSVDEGYMSELVTKIYDLLWDNSGCFVCENSETNIKDTIGEDRALLASTRLTIIVSNLADMESDYGVLPYPMLRETQERYGTRVQDALSLWCVPIDAKDSGMSFAVMEALAAQSWRTTTPVYFDIALKYRYSRDPETSAMMDLIKDSVLINFESLYNRSVGQPWFVLRNLMPAKKNNFASYWAENKKGINHTFENAIKKIKALD